MISHAAPLADAQASSARKMRNRILSQLLPSFFAEYVLYLKCLDIQET